MLDRNLFRTRPLKRSPARRTGDFPGIRFYRTENGKVLSTTAGTGGKSLMELPHDLIPPLPGTPGILLVVPMVVGPQLAQESGTPIHPDQRAAGFALLCSRVFRMIPPGIPPQVRPSTMWAGLFAGGQPDVHAIPMLQHTRHSNQKGCLDNRNIGKRQPLQVISLPDHRQIQPDKVGAALSVHAEGESICTNIGLQPIGRRLIHGIPLTTAVTPHPIRRHNPWPKCA